ncbi:MAG TPA: hypothetical protein PLF21_07550, partial [Exilispira sp.]|nr:hypothetical protein [Exilispira sp.]
MNINASDGNSAKNKSKYLGENIKFRIQKRIGFIFFSFIVLLLIMNIFNEIFTLGYLLSGTGLFYKFLLLLEAIIFFWTTKDGHLKTKRIVQIVFILLNGVMTLYSDINQIYFGLSFLIFGSLLILQYDLFEHRYINYIILIALLLVCTVFIINFYFQEEPSTGGIASEIEDPAKLYVYKITSII